MRRLPLLLIAASLFARPLDARAGVSAEEKVIKAFGNEQHERDVDEAALAAQDKAIARLNQLLKKYRGTSQEPVLLSKLADFQQQNAAILFRLSHGRASHNLARYHQGMKAAIATFSQLIARYPRFEEVHRAYYGRGKGYEETGDQARATQDYLHLVQHFPEVDEAASAFMALAEYAIQAGDHAKAIQYLTQVEKRQDSPHYPFALYKLAWAHYNLKNIATALNYAERQISFYNSRLPSGDRKQSDDGAVSSDTALRENTLLDISVFYFEGYEQKGSQFTLDNAMAYFKSIDNGPSLGRMLSRFAKLLRSHGHDSDLITWKDQVLATQFDRPETLDVVLLATEYQLNKRRYPQLVESVQDIVRLHQKHAGYEGFAAAQKLVIEAAETLQASMLKHKTADDVKSYSQTLATLYDSFTKIVPESDPRIPRVHFNLAETLFAIQDFPGATVHYRWVVDHVKPRDLKANMAASRRKNALTNAPVEEGDLLDASLRAVASRYEVLRRKQLIPTDLKPRAIEKGSPNSLDPLVAEWVGWLDEHVKQSDRDASQFIFEASRALYARGHVSAALDRLMAFVKKYPKSPLAPGAAGLVLDTWIATQDWVRTYELATEFRRLPAFSTGDFSNKLGTIAADAFYKRVEVAHKQADYSTTLSLADDFVKLFPTNRKVSDALALAGGAALASNEKGRALGYFGRLIEAAKANPKDVGGQNLGAALLARGQLSEDRYRFAAAARDYRTFLSLPAGSFKMDGSKADDLRRKTLILSWLAPDPAELRLSLDSPALCTSSTESECARLRVLALLNDADRARTPEVTAEAFANSRKNDFDKQTRALWAVVALEGARNLTFRDRHVALRNAAAGWEELEPLARFTVLPRLTNSIPLAFSLNRAALKDVAPLRADERYITRRVEVVRELENAAAAVMKLPWARIRAETLNEVAGAYIDFAHGILTLQPPKGLSAEETAAYADTMRKITLPFEEKGQEMRAKAFEIASRNAIEEDSFKRISEPFFAENPSQAKRLKPAAQIDAPASLGVDTLAALDPSGDWGKVGRAVTRAPASIDIDDPVVNVKALWYAALRARQWAQVAFFMQEAHEKALVSAGVFSAVKAVSLAGAGARGEALAELEESRKDLPKTRMAAASLLMHHYLRSFSREKTRSFYQEIESDLASHQEKSSAETMRLQSAAKVYVP